MRLLVTRPKPDAEALTNELKGRGHEVLIESLIEIVLLENVHIPVQDVQAIIATSKNGLRALERNSSFEASRTIPLFAVGQSTEAYARALNFQSVVAGPGTAVQLVDTIIENIEPENGPLLHLAGEIVNSELKTGLEEKGIQLFSPIVYKAIASESFEEQTIEAIKSRDIDGVILLSPRTAAIFNRLVLKYHLIGYIHAMTFFCLSTAVSEALDCISQTRLRIADKPKTSEVIALIEKEKAEHP